MGYTEPITWLPEGLTPLKLNTHIRDNFDYLRYRNQVEVTDATDITISATSMAAVNDNIFKLALNVTKNADLLFTFRAVLVAPLVTNNLRLDLLIDDSYYLSSGLPTPSTDGLVRCSVATASQENALALRIPVLDLSEGVHTFSLHAYRGGGNFTLQGTTFRTLMRLEEY